MTWAVDTKTGDVAYQIDGKPAFTDHGGRVSFGNGKDEDAMTGLKLTAQIRRDSAVERHENLSSGRSRQSAA
jgi:hypothetical protein